jgi:hypothetical protein
MKSNPGPAMTLGNAAAAHVRLIVWRRACEHPVEPDPVEMAERYGAETAVPDWHARLVCSQWSLLGLSGTGPCCREQEQPP